MSSIFAILAPYFNFTNSNSLNNTQSPLTGSALVEPSNPSLLSSATKNARLSSSLGSYKRAPRLLLQKYLTNLGLNQDKDRDTDIDGLSKDDLEEVADWERLLVEGWNAAFNTIPKQLQYINKT
jgi:hypothetical protein